MTPQTETGTELKDLILGLDKKIDDVKSDIRVIDTRLKEIDNKLEKLDSKIDRLENRVWTFAVVIFSAALGALWKVFIPN